LALLLKRDKNQHTALKETAMGMYVQLNLKKISSVKIEIYGPI
jgi:hypothetical protein